MISNNKNTFLWVAGLGVAGYFLYKKFGNPLTATPPVNNLLALQLPANVDQSYFIRTPQGLYDVSPAGVNLTGGIHPVPPPHPVPPVSGGDSLLPTASPNQLA